MGILSGVRKAAKAAKKAGKAATPKYKAKRTLDPKIEKELEEQTKTTRAAPSKRKPRAFAQTAAEKAADKTPKPKTDTRVERAGSNVTAAQRKVINDAPSTISLTSLKSKLNKEVDSLKNATATEKKERKDKIANLISDRKETIRKRAADAAKPKKADTRPASKKPQSAEERQQAAIGKSLTPRRAPSSDRKPSMAMMTSYTSMERGEAIAKAGRDLRSGKITQAEHDAIIKRIETKNEMEVVRSAAKRSGKKQVSLPKAPKGMEPERGAARGLFERGGLVKTGHTDMRKGGLFYK